MERRDLACLAEKWPSAIVARSEVGKFSGGLLHPRSMANRDSEGTGPRNPIKVGRKVAYFVDSLLEWMQERQEATSANG